MTRTKYLIQTRWQLANRNKMYRVRVVHVQSSKRASINKVKVNIFRSRQKKSKF